MIITGARGVIRLKTPGTVCQQPGKYVQSWKTVRAVFVRTLGAASAAGTGGGGILLLLGLAMGNNVANVVSMKLGHGGFQESGSIRGSLKEFSKET